MAIVRRKGVGDFVNAYFPEPHNPITGKALAGLGCGGGCGCDDCGGMGAVAVPSFAATWPAPLNQSMLGLPVVYWAGGLVAAAVVLPMLFGGGRRRR